MSKQICPVCRSVDVSARNGSFRCNQVLPDGDVCGFCASFNDWDRVTKQVVGLEVKLGYQVKVAERRKSRNRIRKDRIAQLEAKVSGLTKVITDSVSYISPPSCYMRLKGYAEDALNMAEKDAQPQGSIKAVTFNGKPFSLGSMTVDGEPVPSVATEIPRPSANPLESLRDSIRDAIHIMQGREVTMSTADSVGEIVNETLPMTVRLIWHWNIDTMDSAAPIVVELDHHKPGIAHVTVGETL